MSTDGGPAKRPPGPDLGPSCRAPKRRKQSTPVRIHDPGPNSTDATATQIQDGGQDGQQAPLEDGSRGDTPSPSDEMQNRSNLLLQTYNSRSNDGEENGHAYNENEGTRRGYDSDKRDLNELNDETNISSYAARNSEFLDKYKERLDEKLGTQAYVTSRFAGDNRVNDRNQLEEHDNNHVEKLNAYRVKGLENINTAGEGSGANCRRDSFSVEHPRERERFEMYRPHSVGNKPQDDERIADRYRSQSANDQRQESPDDSENYRNKADDRQSCGRCGLMFPTIDQLRVHYETEHSERNGRTSHGGLECKVEPYEAEDESPGGSMAPGPRMDVTWGVDFQAKMADLYKNAMAFPHDGPKDSLPPNFNPLCPPFPLFPGSVPPQRPMMEPIRIFNPEAYCELCSKEFCNKYFLKTHKANKHGIYENNPSSSGGENLTLENSFMPGAFASSAMKYKNNMMLADYAKSYEAALLASQRHKAKIQRMMEEARDMEKSNTESQPPGMMSVPIVNSRHVQLEDVRSSSDDNTIPENFIFKGDVRHDQEEPFMTPTPRKLSPDSSKRARDSGFNADTLRRLGVINPEAFCKICCKEYCNKYFLKTHKIKRHGLLPSPTDKYAGKDPVQLITERFERKDGQTSPLNLIMGEDNQEKPPQSPEINKAPPNNKDSNQAHANNIRPLSTHSIDSLNAVEVKRDSANEESMKNDQAKQSPTTIFISEDLQKLQTMISQLNDLSVNKIVECYVCKKEFDNNYVLQFHMMSDHGVSMPGSVEAFAFPTASGEDMLADGSQLQKTMCTVCDKDYMTIPLLKKHIEDFHTPKMVFGDPKTSAECLNMEKEANQQRERRASMSLTPTNSYCEICNKELCNKYFMKTHMQRMHGIEIENGTQIGGVICDICNKELCSKYFLRVHKHNTHGIVEPGAPLPQMRNLTGEPEPFSSPQVSSPLKPPPEASILNNRFIAHFIEVCPFCSRRFRTSKWLKAHLLSDHGKAGIDKWKELEVQYKAQAKAQAAKTNKPTGGTLSIPDTGNMSNSSPNMPLDLQERLPFYSKLVEPKLLNMFSLNNPDMKTYNCSYCPFSTSILSFLYVHEKSHVQGPEMDILCPMCPESFSKPEALQFHIITSHSLPEWRERVGPDSSPSSTREYQNRQSASKTPEASEDNKEQIPAGNGKAEMFECYECEFKSCSFGEMEGHLRSQHFAVREGNIDPVTNNDGENNYGEDLTRKNKMPAIYAVPTNLDLEGSDNQPSSITMQPFVIEENAPEVSGGKFVPSLVFLPVRRRTTGVITISFNLTPA